MAVAALVAAAVLAVIIIVATSGGSHNASSQGTAGKTATHHSGGSHGAASTGSAAGGSSTTSGGSGGGTGAAASSAPTTSANAGAPVSAVESFYHLAAAHQYSSAWALADPSFRSQLGGYPSFQSGQAGDRSITFNAAQVQRQTPTSAVVYVRTTSVRDNGTQHCYGPVNLVHGSSGWLLDHISINCTP